MARERELQHREIRHAARSRADVNDMIGLRADVGPGADGPVNPVTTSRMPRVVRLVSSGDSSGGNFVVPDT